MYHIRILSVGKTKEQWLDEAIDEYLKRLQPTAAFYFIWVKDDLQLIAAVDKEKQKGTAVVCLDPQGKTYTSEQFSQWLVRQMELGGSHIALVIGGAEGLPETLRKGFPLISLSPLTFTHQLTRLILIEQIYRAFEIAKGTRYHK